MLIWGGGATEENAKSKKKNPVFSWCEKRLYQITITYSPRLTPPSCKHRVRAPPTLNLIMINTRVLFPCQTQNYTHQARILRCPESRHIQNWVKFRLFCLRWKTLCFHHYTTTSCTAIKTFRNNCHFYSNIWLKCLQFNLKWQ